jgi:hypothetical protein
MFFMSFRIPNPFDKSLNQVFRVNLSAQTPITPHTTDPNLPLNPLVVMFMLTLPIQKPSHFPAIRDHSRSFLVELAIFWVP